MGRNITIIGAGIGGLTAALLLARAGLAVTLCEAAKTPGGKLREVAVGGEKIDAGPTVFTLRPVFEAIFADAGAKLTDHISLNRLDILARHGWEDGTRLDLFANTGRNAAAIGDFAGAKAARGYETFAKRAKQIFETLDQPFMQAPQPGLAGLIRNAGPGLLRISPFATLWAELGRYFENPKLRQLFGRYATYCGSSPFSAPATLMLIAHAELLGVWEIAGGMHSLAVAMAKLAAAQGVVFRYDTKVTEILSQNNKVSGIRLADGTVMDTDAVIANADLAALATGLFGASAKQAVAGMMQGAQRSLSARTYAITGVAAGFPLSHHNVFFSSDYPAEFAALARGQIPPDPTIYICASGPGKFFCLVNAPANGDTQQPWQAEEQQCLTTMLEKLSRFGLKLNIASISATGPETFATMFPGSGGALYGRALAGWRDTFARPGASTAVSGLYLAGGSVHPGPGLPMAALSGRQAAQRVLADFASTRR